MTYQIEIQASIKPETLERLLRVTRHRGFKVESLNMNTLSDGQSMQLSMRVSSERDISLLASQLDKLIDINSVLTSTAVYSEQKRA